MKSTLDKLWKKSLSNSMSTKSPHEGKATEWIEDLKSHKDKNSGSATGTHSLVVYASAIEKPGTWVRVLASVRFFICSVASFLLCCPCDAQEGPISTKVAYLNTNVDSKRHIIIRTATLYIYIYELLCYIMKSTLDKLWKNTLSNSMSRKSPHEVNATDWI